MGKATQTLRLPRPPHHRQQALRGIQRRRNLGEQRQQGTGGKGRKQRAGHGEAGGQHGRTPEGSTAGKHRRDSLTTLRTSAEALLRLTLQRWSIEHSWHWVRDVLLWEDAHPYKLRNGVQELPILMTMAMNLWRRSEFLSIRAGLLAVSRGIERHAGWFGIPAVARGLVDLQQTMGPG